MKKWKLSFLVMTLFCTYAFADEIQLITGEILEGHILEETDREIYFENQSGMKNYSLRNLKRINNRIVVVEDSSPSEKAAVKIEQGQLHIKPLAPHVVRAAYQAIPHTQTTYDAKTSVLPKEESENLEKIFTLVDHALVSKVETLKYFQTGGQEGRDFVTYEKEMALTLKTMEKIDVKDEVETAKELIMQAMKNQRMYFAEWQKALDRKKTFPFQLAAGFSWQQQKNIQAANQQLVQAYSTLKRKYVNETTRNQQAMFDHLCALDFI